MERNEEADATRGDSRSPGSAEQAGQMVDLPVDSPIWNRFFYPSSLVLIGTKEGDRFDLAPKHMAMPVSWENYFGFVCTPRHGTYHNVRRERAFTVSLPRPEQLVVTSLAAQPRGESGETFGLELLPTEPAREVEGVLLRRAYLQLECELEQVIDGLGANSLILGRVCAARVGVDAIRTSEGEDAELLEKCPLLVYVHPGRYAVIRRTDAFPFPADFSR